MKRLKPPRMAFVVPCFFKNRKATHASRNAPESFSTMNQSSRPHLVRITSAALHMRRPTLNKLDSIRVASNFSCSTEWLAQSNGPWSKWGIGYANTVQSANCYLECHISLGDCSRTPLTKDF